MSAVIEERIRPRRFDVDEIALTAASMLFAIAACWLLFYAILPFSGTLGFWLITYVVFLATVLISARKKFGAIVAQDLLAKVIVYVAMDTAGNAFPFIDRPNPYRCI